MKMKKELLEIQKELTESYKEKTSAEYILGVVSKKIIIAAQDAINKANTTSSYDEKISTLVQVVQDIVQILSDEKTELSGIESKYIDQAEIIEVLINQSELPAPEK
jgi:hypothetical protein